jgi:hypothetical protein
MAMLNPNVEPTSLTRKTIADLTNRYAGEFSDLVYEYYITHEARLCRSLNLSRIRSLHASLVLWEHPYPALTKFNTFSWIRVP